MKPNYPVGISSGDTLLPCSCFWSCAISKRIQQDPARRSRGNHALDRIGCASDGACFVWAFNATGTFFHLISIIGTDLHRTGEASNGADKVSSVVPQVYLTCAISSSCFTLLVGYLFDRMNPKFIMGKSISSISRSIHLIQPWA